MVIFTPNTVIKSADVNLNNAELANIANWSNPYKFAAYMASTQSITAATWTKPNFNTESYDTNNNYNITTYGYTIPITGYYLFTLSILLQSQAGTVFTIALSTNGTTEYVRLSSIPNTTGDISLTGSADLYFTAGTIVYPLVYTVTTKTIYNTNAYTRFSGHLISAT